MQPGQIEGSATYNWREDRRLLACVVAVALLVNAALRSNGDGYYTFLRLYICGLASILGLYDWRQKRVWQPISAAMIAILFNPFRPIEMDGANDWYWYDMGTAGWFALVGGRSLLGNYGFAARRYVIAGIALIAFAAAVPMALVQENDSANNTMNVDENLTTTDVSATDMNAVGFIPGSRDLPAPQVDPNPAADQAALAMANAQTENVETTDASANGAPQEWQSAPLASSLNGVNETESEPDSDGTNDNAE